jgi:hypothetical protein
VGHYFLTYAVQLVLDYGGLRVELLGNGIRASRGVGNKGPVVLRGNPTGEVGATGGVETAEYLYELKDRTYRRLSRHLGVWRTLPGPARSAAQRTSAGTAGIQDEVSTPIVTPRVGHCVAIFDSVWELLLPPALEVAVEMILLFPRDVLQVLRA